MKDELDDGRAETANQSGEQTRSWQERSIERRLGDARARALARSSQFLATAFDLVQESGQTNFTLIFGTPTGTQGFSGRYKHVQIHKFLMAGQIDWYELESDDTAAMTLLPGEHACMAKGQARDLTIHPGSWHIEDGRGAVATTLPFAMVDTLLVSLELESVRRSAVEFSKLVRRRLRR